MLAACVELIEARLFSAGDRELTAMAIVRSEVEGLVDGGEFRGLSYLAKALADCKNVMTES
jgi:hypothetical protein